MSGPDEEDVATRVVSRDEADKLRSDRVTPQGQAADGLDVTMDDSPRAIRSSFAKALDQRAPKVLGDQDRAPMTGGSSDELVTGDMPSEPSWMDVSDDHTVSEDSATKDQRPARIEVINAPRKLDRTTPVTARPLESGNRSSRRDDSTGTPFGPYQLLGVVGLGGMAEVRLASRTSPSGARELCVIKRILAEHSDRDDYMDMFTEEARLGRLLEHDNVVQMIDSGMIDGLTYIALELVDGTTASRLAEANPRNCVPVHVVAEIGIQVSKALAYAHTLTDSRGNPLSLVHRDVSPGNVLISRRGEVKLADFGIARFEGRRAATEVGTVKGKLTYASPEQLRTGLADPRTDIFSLGVVMIELLTGKPLFAVSSVSESSIERLVRQRLLDAPASVPADLTELLCRMTAERPENRPDYVEIVQRELQDLVNESSTTPDIHGYFRTIFDRIPGVMEMGGARRERPGPPVALPRGLSMSAVYEAPRFEEESPEPDFGDHIEEATIRDGYVPASARPTDPWSAKTRVPVASRPPQDQGGVEVEPTEAVASQSRVSVHPDPAEQPRTEALVPVRNTVPSPPPERFRSHGESRSTEPAPPPTSASVSSDARSLGAAAPSRSDPLARSEPRADPLARSEPRADPLARSELSGAPPAEPRPSSPAVSPFLLTLAVVLLTTLIALLVMVVRD